MLDREGKARLLNIKQQCRTYGTNCPLALKNSSGNDAALERNLLAGTYRAVISMRGVRLRIYIEQTWGPGTTGRT